MSSKLEQLKAHSVVVADTGEINAIKEFQPQDCTTNPSLVLKAAQRPEYAHLVTESIEWAKKRNSEHVASDAIDKLAVRIGTELTRLVPGYVSTEVDASLSFNTEKMIEKARKLIGLYAEEGVAKERILIKIATTWEGVQAAKVLEQEGIRCNLTLVFALEQAIACAQSGVTLISPFVGRITDWYKKSQKVESFEIAEDPGVNSVKTIYRHFKDQGYQTIVMGASFRSAAQVEALAGCDRLTVSPQLLKELSEDLGELKRALDPAAQDGVQKDEILTEEAFRWGMNQNAMATEKLAEGIRQFHADYEKLQALIEQQLGVVSVH
ncbi:transaldolase [Deinococcus roseus]|uniref:Transaldolase n=1 Tax=Deinococcus roseus TaxID=392414 RepID=A0ABQ2D2P8_9DEIO|nr:transaldolase [Deinococcus roseus]GGJ43637.1 transaldolase [Deinococcus roseus]